jgi:hypothetical protein
MMPNAAPHGMQDELMERILRLERRVLALEQMVSDLRESGRKNRVMVSEARIGPEKNRGVSCCCTRLWMRVVLGRCIKNGALRAAGRSKTYFYRCPKLARRIPAFQYGTIMD